MVSEGTEVGSSLPPDGTIGQKGAATFCAACLQMKDSLTAPVGSFLEALAFHVLNPEACSRLGYEHTFPTATEIVWFTQKMTRKPWNYMQMSSSLLPISPSQLQTFTQLHWFVSVPAFKQGVSLCY